MEKDKRFFYPYCGWKLGFCILAEKCTLPENIFHFTCKYFRLKHPISKQRPHLSRRIDAE